MPSNPTADSKPLPASRIIPGPTPLRQYPAHNLVAWQPRGVLDDQLLDEIGEWLCHIEKASVPFKRFVDFSRLTSVAVRTKHVFAFARQRAEQFAGLTPVKSALFSEDWVCFGIALCTKSDEGNADRCACISRPRDRSRLAACAGGDFETRR